MRLFVALDVAAPVREALAAWGRDVAAEDPALRPVAVEALHLTLAFLGEREDAGELAGAVTRAARPVSGARVAGALWLAPRRPHVLCAAVADPDGALEALFAAVRGELEPFGWQPDHPVFRPHVTVCRVRRGARPRTLEVPAPPALDLGATELQLVRSRLGGGPARYERVAGAGVGTGRRAGTRSPAR